MPPTELLMPFEFRPAARENVGLLVGLAGGTGSGKTFSALRLAKGICGDEPFGLIDTEAGRAKHYADRFKFDHCDFPPPHSPDRYLAAITAADQRGYKAIVVDSASHEWAGEGGVLDLQEAELSRMAGDDYKRREACKMASWIKPKTAHKHMMTKLLQVRAHLILCFRAEPKVEMRRGEGGRMEVTAKEGLTGLNGWFPITEKSLPYELTAYFLLMAERPGVPMPIKLEEQHRSVFTGGQITEETGAALARWASGGVVTRPPIKQTERQAAASDPTLYEQLEFAIQNAPTLGALKVIGLEASKLTKADADKLRPVYRERESQLSEQRQPGQEG